MVGLGGVQATLMVQGNVFPNGFCSLDKLTLGPNMVWVGKISWYMTRAAYDEKLGSFSSSDPKDTPPEFFLPYVPDQDIVKAAKERMLTWFQDGVILDAMLPPPSPPPEEPGDEQDQETPNQQEGN